MSYQVTAAFRAALLDDHNVVTRATVTNDAGVVLATLSVVSGSVTVDVDRAARREAGDLQIVDPTGTLTPRNIDDLLSPLNGYEIRLSRGIEYANGSTELVPLGVFGYTSVALENGPNGLTVSLGGLIDRSERVRRARYSKRVIVTSGQSVESAVLSLVQAGWPQIPIGNGSLPETGKTMPAVAYGVEGDGDPWSDALALAEAKGHQLFFDVFGELQMQPIVTTVPTTGIVNYGSTQLMVTSLSKTWDTADTYNGVIAVGEGSGLLIIPRAVVWDDDPASPTYYGGPFGQRPRIYSSPLLLTVEDCIDAGRVQLLKSLGLGEALQWSQIVDPSLDVNDAVGIIDADLGVNAVYLLSRLTIPLSPLEAMTAEAKVRRLT